MKPAITFRSLLYFVSFLFLLSFTQCAKKGTPSGGPRDTIPPHLLRAIPENYSTHFNTDEIEVRFDEYIKLKDLQAELVVSPPMKNNPFITPLNTSKTLKIKINDTLLPNTTYVFNFGNSVTDNNEGNVLRDFKYVFSTGSYIDSLKLRGRVRDAQKVVPDFPVTVMLYEFNENYSDSVIYSQKPLYITSTKDTTGIFEFTNLREGRYKLIALKEKTRNYTFVPKEDQIGFISSPVLVPSDSSYVLTMFKETPPAKIFKPSLAGKQHLIFGYQGRIDSLNVEMLNIGSTHIDPIIYKEEKRDTLHYWFKPEIQADSLLFAAHYNKKTDTLQVRHKELYRDSLNISLSSSGRIRLKDSLTIRVSTPISAVDSERVKITSSDSVLIKGEIFHNKKYNRAEIFFPKEEDKEYKVLLLPGAITDFFNRASDSLRFSVKTRNSSDYGTLRLHLENVKRFPLIVQLVDEKYAVIAEDYLTENREIYFDELNPNKYFLRIIYDDNRNRRWDTGSFLEDRAPEEVIYYPRRLDVRANWSLNEKFILK